MALNDIERKILESVRRSIQAKNQTYICYAIDRARVRWNNRQDVYDAKNRLKNYIHRKLEGNGTLGYWLALKHRHDMLFMDKGLQREARIAWITWMLGEEILVDVQIAKKFAEYFNLKQNERLLKDLRPF
jgi:hypothetical protein